MEKIFYIGDCPICRYGRLEIHKDIAVDEYFVMCEECFAEWKNPQDALQNIRGKRTFGKGAIRSATIDEIKILGWDKFVVGTENV